ncbi:MAG: class I SAM-dependent methyltransferase [Pseudomonadota bacterium]
MFFKDLLNNFHSVTVMNRRVKVLSKACCDMMETGGSVLDVGCGDGTVALSILSHRPDLNIVGVDVFLRPKVAIPAIIYNGTKIPYDTKTFDYVMIVDVLHHTDNPVAVLSECLRVSKKGVIIKDHLLTGFAARQTLRFMDWVGNRGHDVRLPYNYLSEDGWKDVFEGAGCQLVR